MRIKLFVAGILGMVALFLGTSVAQDSGISPSLRAKLAQSIEVSSQNQLQILDITSTPLPNIYEVELNTGEILYTDVSGDYLFAGDMYATSESGLVNLSAGKRQIRTAEKIALIDESEMIIFEPDELKSSITVFTDVDCTYCRALHRDLEDILAYGIRVRYLAYPRGGENADSFEKMISVWCSDDRKRTLTQAKNGQNLPERDCDTPILEHYALGNELGISGTPALILPDGQLIPGYVEPERLAALLKLI